MNADLLGYLAGWVNGDAARVHRGRWVDLTFLLGIALEPYGLRAQGKYQSKSRQAEYPFRVRIGKFFLHRGR